MYYIGQQRGSYFYCFFSEVTLIQMLMQMHTTTPLKVSVCVYFSKKKYVNANKYNI